MPVNKHECFDSLKFKTRNGNLNHSQRLRGSNVMMCSNTVAIIIERYGVSSTSELRFAEYIA